MPRSRDWGIFFGRLSDPVGAGLLAKAVSRLVEIFDGVHIHFCGSGGLWFRSYSDSLFQTPKSKQKAWPRRSARSLGLGVPSLRDRSGGIASGLLRCTYFRCVRLRRTALRAHPRIDPSTQPAEGAGTARSRAVLELALIVLSGEKPKRFRFTGWAQSLLELACQRWRPGSRPVSDKLHTVQM